MKTSGRGLSTLFSILVVALIVTLLVSFTMKQAASERELCAQYDVGSVMMLKTGERVLVKHVSSNCWIVLYPGGREVTIYPEMVDAAPQLEKEVP